MRIKPLLLCLGFCLGPSPAVYAQDGGDWNDRISLKGDFRLRYEGISEQGEEDRARGRYRARLAMTAEATDKIDIVMQLASGADDPVSRNVTFDGGFNVDDIGFDLVYVDWAVADGWNVFGGKMKNPLFRAGGVPLVWDSDLNPEGVAVKYSKGPFFATLANFSVEERSSSSDSLLHALQLGGTFNIGEGLKLTAGAGYFGYSSTVGNEPFYNGNPKGNSVDDDGNYLYDYRNVEVFAQLDTRVGDWPLSVFGHWTRNNEVDVEDTGYSVGARVGSASNDGDWRFTWAYQEIEADAVIATFNDSDFGGGGTDSSGHILNVNYMVAKNVSLAGTFFINEVDRFQGEEHDYDRFQLDVQFSFK